MDATCLSSQYMRQRNVAEMQSKTLFIKWCTAYAQQGGVTEILSGVVNA